MRESVRPSDFATLGVEPPQAAELAARANTALQRYAPSARDAAAQERLWSEFQSQILGAAAVPFPVHEFLYALAYEGRQPDAGPGPAWIPSTSQVEASNLGRMMKRLNQPDYASLHHWSTSDRDRFWAHMMDQLQIAFHHRATYVRDPKSDVTSPRWLPGAEFNIVDSCFQTAQDQAAIVYAREGENATRRVTYGELEELVNRVAQGLDRTELGERDSVVLYLPMTPESVAAYLGVIRSGRAVVGIADTSAPRDLANKIRISQAKLVITTDGYVRGGKPIPIFPKVVEANAPPAILFASGQDATSARPRAGDKLWEDFLGPGGQYRSRMRGPDDTTNILFSSGTTKDPKAIPWTQTSPLKSIVDAWCHHDVRPCDILAWPTSFGWMMGPWLTYASLVNHATMAIYNGEPRSRDFGRFVQDARVTMLGVVPKLVAAWRAARTMEGLDWSRIRVFSSTGETSDPDDMLYLMHLAGYKPVIEYCGGTEIGGGYITGTVVQPAVPGAFTTPSMGLDLYVLDAAGRPSDRGEVGIVPPSIGLSNALLNDNHFEEYYKGFHRGPHGEVLRRHGDQLERRGPYYRHLGRSKDTINLNGVKTSSEEIRNVIKHHPVIDDAKPFGVDVDGSGQQALVVYAVPRDRSQVGSRALRERLKKEFSQRIKSDLSPLLSHVHDVVLVPELPQAGPGKTRTSEWFQADYRSKWAEASARR